MKWENGKYMKTEQSIQQGFPWSQTNPPDGYSITTMLQPCASQQTGSQKWGIYSCRKTSIKFMILVLTFSDLTLPGLLQGSAKMSGSVCTDHIRNPTPLLCTPSAGMPPSSSKNGRNISCKSNNLRITDSTGHIRICLISTSATKHLIMRLTWSPIKNDYC